MFITTQKIKDLLSKKKLSQNKLASLIDYNRGALGHMINGEVSFPPALIEKIAPILEVSSEEIQGWILADKYSKETLETAINVKKESLQQAQGEIATPASQARNDNSILGNTCRVRSAHQQDLNITKKTRTAFWQKLQTTKKDLIITQKIDEMLQIKDISRSELSRKIKHNQGGLNAMIIGKESVSKSVIKKIAEYFQISQDEIRGWIIADKYSIEILKIALVVKNDIE